MSRRLPVYLLIDTSGSMNGEPIAAVNHGLQSLIATLRQEPFALESVHLSVLTFDREVREVLPLTPLARVEAPQLTPPSSGPTLLGKALAVLMEKLDRNLIRNSATEKGDWKPLLFVMTDGKPSDTAQYREMSERLKSYRLGATVVCVAGQEPRTEPLRLLTEDIYPLATMDGASFTQFFQWVSRSIARGVEAGTGIQDSLPPPPQEMTLVL
ncbi:MAG: VWA domain-containing protein [Oligosphaeraceae bacterium]